MQSFAGAVLAAHFKLSHNLSIACLIQPRINDVVQLSLAFRRHQNPFCHSLCRSAARTRIQQQSLLLKLGCLGTQIDPSPTSSIFRLCLLLVQLFRLIPGISLNRTCFIHSLRDCISCEVLCGSCSGARRSNTGRNVKNNEWVLTKLYKPILYRWS